jgi:hypothetical protein
MAAERGWQRKFEDPIPLPDGRELVTLRDAATHITALPKTEAALPEWQAAIEALMLVAERDGPTFCLPKRNGPSLGGGLGPSPEYLTGGFGGHDRRSGARLSNRAMNRSFGLF